MTPDLETRLDEASQHVKNNYKLPRPAPWELDGEVETAQVNLDGEHGAVKISPDFASDKSSSALRGLFAHELGHITEYPKTERTSKRDWEYIQKYSDNPQLVHGLLQDFVANTGVILRDEDIAGDLAALYREMDAPQGPLTARYEDIAETAYDREFDFGGAQEHSPRYNLLRSIDPRPLEVRADRKQTIKRFVAAVDDLLQDQSESYSEFPQCQDENVVWGSDTRKDGEASEAGGDGSLDPDSYHEDILRIHEKYSAPSTPPEEVKRTVQGRRTKWNPSDGPDIDPERSLGQIIPGVTETKPEEAKIREVPDLYLTVDRSAQIVNPEEEPSPVLTAAYSIIDGFTQEGAEVQGVTCYLAGDTIDGRFDNTEELKGLMTHYNTGHPADIPIQERDDVYEVLVANQGPGNTEEYARHLGNRSAAAVLTGGASDGPYEEETEELRHHLDRNGVPAVEARTVDEAAGIDLRGTI